MEKHRFKKPIAKFSVHFDLPLSCQNKSFTKPLDTPRTIRHCLAKSHYVAVVYID